MRGLVAMVLAIASLAFSGGPALAAPEWCDNGSPPANDFGHRPTGAPSAGSSLGWLASTQSGVIDVAAGVNTLEGGVAHGMQMAVEHSRSYDSLPHATASSGD